MLGEALGFAPSSRLWWLSVLYLLHQRVWMLFAVRVSSLLLLICLPPLP